MASSWQYLSQFGTENSRGGNVKFVVVNILNILYICTLRSITFCTSCNLKTFGKQLHLLIFFLVSKFEEQDPNETDIEEVIQKLKVSATGKECRVLINQQ